MEEKSCYSLLCVDVVVQQMAMCSEDCNSIMYLVSFLKEDLLLSALLGELSAKGVIVDFLMLCRRRKEWLSLDMRLYVE